jgi:hypothetical protein
MKLLIYIFFSFVAFASFSQTKAKLSVSKIQIGEQVVLNYTFEFKESDGKLSFIPLNEKIVCLKINKKSSLPANETVDLELINTFEDSIAILGNGRFRWIGKYRITAWDTGLFLIPKTSISTQSKVYVFDSLYLEVSFPQSKEGQDIYDIKESFVEIPSDTFSWLKNNWVCVGLILLAVAILLYLKFGKKKQKLEIKKELTLKELSIIAVDALEKEKLWEKAKLKEHYIELSYILRSYLGARYSMNLLEKTSFEASSLLSRKELEKETVQLIKKILDYADLVKFAKSSPEDLEIRKNLAQVKQIITETSPIQIDHV